MAAPYFVPAADLLPYWPHDLVAPSDVGILGRISQYAGVTEFELVDYEDELCVIGTLALWDELVLDLPLAEGLQLVVGQPGPNTTTLPFELRFGPLTEEVDGGLEDHALNMFLKGRQGPYELVLPEVDIGLRFRPDDLPPMRPRVAADLTQGFEPDPTRAATQLTFRTSLVVNSATGVDLQAPGDLDLPYCQIGSSGVVISAQDIIIRLSDSQPMPDNIDPAAFDLDEDWKGVYLGNVQVFNLDQLVEWLPARLDLSKWFIGRGGVTGKATAVMSLDPDMANQDFAVRAYRLAFRQNILLEGLVQVAVKLAPFDDKVVYLDLAITVEPGLAFPESVGFMGALSGAQPPHGADTLRPGELFHLPLLVARIGVTRLGVRAKPDRGRAGTDHPRDTRFWDLLLDGRIEISPEATVSDSLFGGEFTDLQLTIAPEFEYKLPGGLWVSMSEAARAKVANWPIQVSRIGFGKAEPEYWVGLDASIDFGRSIPAATSVKGLRVYWNGPAGVRLEFEGISIEADYRGFALKGFVSMITGAADPNAVADPTDRIFRGDVTLSIAGDPAVAIEGSLLFGTKDGTRFGYFSLDAEFGTGIPIFGSVSWFGAALLAGINVTPDRALTGDHGDDFNWYQHWYAPPPGPHSILNARKWVPMEDAWAIGAGVSIGSSDGTAWSLKALLAVIAPGPVIIFDGHLSLLKTREPHAGPPTSTMIHALAVLDWDQGDFLLAFEVDYKLPKSGLLLDVQAAGEVFSGHRPNDWHVAIGWPEPLSRRVRAKALRLLDWDAYFVITGRDLELAERTFPGTALAVGYRTGIDKRGKWGPVRGVLAVWVAGDVAMSFDPTYILAELTLHGEASVKVYGIGFELMLDALIALEAPVGDDDLFFGGKVRIKLGLPWPLPDIKKDIPFEWGDQSGLPPPITPMVDIASVSPGYTVVGERFFERDAGPIAGVSMPLDGRIAISFRRPMRSTWAGAPTPVGLALPDRVGDVYYRYTLETVRVRVTPGAGSPHDATEDLFGQWTIGPGDANGPYAEGLVLWGLTPFPAAGNLAWPGRTERRSWADIPFETNDRWPCATIPPTERCVDFRLVPLGVKDPELHYQPDPAYRAVVFTPWPSAERGDSLEDQPGEFVQVPQAVVTDGGAESGDHVLRLARTTFLGSKESHERTSGAIGDGLILHAAGVDLPPSVHARGRVEFVRDLMILVVSAVMDDAEVATVVGDGPEFEIDTNGRPFNRLIIRLQSRDGPQRDRGGFHVLSELCYTTIGALETDADARAQRDLWLHVLGPLTIDEPETNDDRFGDHLVHEPFATYRIELDIRTESAEAVEGPWDDRGLSTEVLTLATGGAPADLQPYVASVAPGDGARPFYADYDLRITYNQPYVEAMYARAGDPLVAALFTAGGRRVEPEIVRGRTANPAITGEVGILVDRLIASDCVPVDLDTIVGFDETVYRTRLSTGTAYEVRISGGGHAAPVYAWSFVTSRYRTFAEHLADLRPSPWHERLATGVDWSAVAGRLAATTDRGVEDEAWRAIWRADLGYSIRTLPERPEITILWQAPAGTPEARLLSIVSPEPLFATDRTTVALERRTVRMVLTPAGPKTIASWRDVPHRLVRSVDGTRALLVPVDAAGQPVPLPAGRYRLQAVYRLTGVEGMPDLSRLGDSSDESSTWAFSLPLTPATLVDPEA